MGNHRRSNGFDRQPSSQARAFLLSSVLGILALASASPAHAYITVGPDGQYQSVQDGINAAIANQGDEVRVETRNCAPFQCYYHENVYFNSSYSINLSGGWSSDFLTQVGTSEIRGVDGVDAPIIDAIATGGAVTQVERFYVNGTGRSPGYYTHGLVASANNTSIVTVADNVVANVGIQTSSGTSGSADAAGGAGLAVRAADSGYMIVSGNTIQSNSSLGTDSHATFGGGTYVATIGGGHIDFVLNTVTGNHASNASGGACRGGGLWASAQDTSTMQLRKNVYSGNSQLGCNSGATGDAAEIEATSSASIDVFDETWTNNNVPNDPGVYEVYMQADVSSQILAQNGLITHGTWGGLFANSIASGQVTISNYTIADNPVLAFRGVGAGTQLWNTLLWNTTANEFDSGATEAYCLLAADPLFADAASGDYHLTAGSPAINAGTNAPTGGLRTIDLDGHPRPDAGTADIGAYEFKDTIFGSGFE